uniref:Tetraspanin family protein n=1 Tax=Branchiostoma belcheri tsingtauense TaxID=155462 RepID=Q2TCR7_BRABE|nr:tetraspanin family protein [Branchiostoma belcheri tsingtauense]
MLLPDIDRLVCFGRIYGVWTLQYKFFFAPLLASPLYSLGVSVMMAAGGSALATCMVDVCICLIYARSDCKKPFLGLLVVTTFLGLASGIVLFISKNEQVDDTLADSLRMSLELRYGQPGEGGVTFAWDRTQEKLQCCGVGNRTSGYLAWRRSMWYANQTEVRPSAQVPQSCCIMDDDTGQAHQCQFDVPNQFLNEKGCQDTVQNVFFDHAKELGIVATVVSLIELMILLVTISTLRDL